MYAGLAGLYMVRDALDTGLEPNGLGVPGGAYEIPLVFADRLFDGSGAALLRARLRRGSPSSSATRRSSTAPCARTSPSSRGQYRFRILNASNARFWNLSIQGGPPAVQIGSDGGLFNRPVPLSKLHRCSRPSAPTSSSTSPRFAGRTLTVTNSRPPARRLEPGPAARRRSWRSASAGGSPSAGPARIPATLPGSMPALGAPSVTRNITLEEVENADTGEPEYGSLNGRKFDDARGVQERPRVGSTEDWRLVNLTEDTHPIHLHLVQFQIMDRTPFDADGYKAALEQARATDPDAAEPRPAAVLHRPGRPCPTRTSAGGRTRSARTPARSRGSGCAGRCRPGVTAPQRYVFHCHILEHEDNSMMRPLEIVA